MHGLDKVMDFVSDRLGGPSPKFDPRPSPRSEGTALLSSATCVLRSLGPTRSRCPGYVLKRTALISLLVLLARLLGTRPPNKAVIEAHHMSNHAFTCVRGVPRVLTRLGFVDVGNVASGPGHKVQDFEGIFRLSGRINRRRTSCMDTCSLNTTDALHK